MKKVAWLFLIAVFVPTLALGWLAFRSVGDQDVLLERQQTLLLQGVAETAARDLRQRLELSLKTFSHFALEWAAQPAARTKASEFSGYLSRKLDFAGVGFAVTLDGEMLSPQQLTSTTVRRFRAQNDRFLCGQESVQVYCVTPPVAGTVTNQTPGRIPIEVGVVRFTKDASADFDALPATPPEITTPPPPNSLSDVGGGAPVTPSSPSPSQGQFRNLIRETAEGSIARFVEDQLSLIYWHRSLSDLVLGVEVDVGRLVRHHLMDVIKVADPLAGEAALALLDDKGVPVAKSDSKLTLDWSRPLATVQLGQALPHWQVAAYALHPERQALVGRNLKLALGSLIALLVVSICVGGGWIVADVRRQMRLAQQKTDFVSHVSHELKTPLTSIRMFAELLMEDRGLDPEKRSRFLGVITAETARLTRLINNVLDFARLERGEQRLSLVSADLTEITTRTLAAYRPHLEASGYTLLFTPSQHPLPVQVDIDSTAQVLLNLLSNAEKYGGETREITVNTNAVGERVEVQVLDRGPGVLAGLEERIFEQFVRGDDSLTNSVQGTGLGLTLARQIARAQGGDVTYHPRPDGGSCFTLSLPRCPSTPTDVNSQPNP